MVGPSAQAVRSHIRCQSREKSWLNKQNGRATASEPGMVFASFPASCLQTCQQIEFKKILYSFYHSDITPNGSFYKV